MSLETSSCRMKKVVIHRLSKLFFYLGFQNKFSQLLLMNSFAHVLRTLIGDFIYQFPNKKMFSMSYKSHIEEMTRQTQNHGSRGSMCVCVSGKCSRITEGARPRFTLVEMGLRN